MAAAITSLQVNTVAGNTRFRILRFLPENTTDTLNVGGGGIRMAKMVNTPATDIAAGISREAITAVDKNNVPGFLTFVGVPISGAVGVFVVGTG